MGISGLATHAAFSCNGGTNWSDWLALAPDFDGFDITTGATGCSADNGSKTITVKVKDVVGQESSTQSDTTYYDTTGPGGSITNSSGDPTKDDTPLLDLTISGDGVEAGSASEMRFSCDNSTWTDWEAYATPKTNFDIKPAEAAYGCGTSDGSRTVYIQYRDSLGNVGSSANTGAFTLDTTAPVVTAVQPSASTSVKTFYVAYELGEGAASGSVTWTRTDGTADGDSPHVVELVSSGDISAGSHEKTLTISPPLVYDTVYAVTFSFTDAAGNTGSDEVLSVTYIQNAAPVAQNAAAIIPVSTATAVEVTATDGNSDPLTYSTVAGPLHGSLSAWTANSVTYTPTAGYLGYDSFTYKANDGTDDSNTATVNLTVGLKTYVVTTTAIENDGDCHDGDCTLLEAVAEANADSGASYIDFAAKGTFEIADALALSDASGGTTIFGGSAHDVVINGSGTGGHNCFTVSSSDNIIQGLVIQNCGNGVYISSSSGNKVQGNYIGTDATGNAASGTGNNYGVFIAANGTSNIIGTDGDGTNDINERNIISGNIGYGVYLYSTASNVSGNIVAGNFVGLGQDGTTPVANGTSGIVLVGGESGGPSGNIIGVDDTKSAPQGMGNLVSGNTQHGILLLKANGNMVAGNIVGLDVTGAVGKGNGQNGIYLNDATSNNIVGTDGDGNADAFERNVTSGQSIGTGYGIALYGSSSSTYPSNNRIAGNFIGTNAAGNGAVANKTGILVGQYATGNIIGTNSDGNGDGAEGNLISGNTSGKGIWLYNNATNNVVAGNRIGADITGGTALANGGDIVIEQASSGNRIGTDGNGTNDLGEKNVIVGSTNECIKVTDSGSNSNLIKGNNIGVGANETTDLGCGLHGVHILSSAASNVVDSNLIRYNGDAASEYGVLIASTAGVGNKLTMNSVYDNQEAQQILVQDYGAGYIATPTVGSLAPGTSAGKVKVTVTTASGNTVEAFGGSSGGLQTYLGTATDNSDGTYTYETTSLANGATVNAVVYDASGNTSSAATTYATIANVKPVANAGSDQNVTEEDTPVQLSGSGSYDPNTGDSVTTYTWSETVDASNSCALSATDIVNPTVALTNRTSNYSCTYQLIVNDGDLDSDADTMTINVTADNDTPTLTTVNTIEGGTEDTPKTISYADVAAAGNEADVDSSAISFRV